MVTATSDSVKSAEKRRRNSSSRNLAIKRRRGMPYLPRRAARQQTLQRRQRQARSRLAKRRRDGSSKRTRQATAATANYNSVETTSGRTGLCAGRAKAWRQNQHLASKTDGAYRKGGPLKGKAAPYLCIKSGGVLGGLGRWRAKLWHGGGGRTWAPRCGTRL